MYIFIVLWWYCDHVFASNRGVAHSLYFPLQKSYWLSVFPCCRKDHRAARDNMNVRVIKEKDLEVEVEGALNSAENEKQKVLEGEARDVFADGLRVVGIEKTY